MERGRNGRDGAKNGHSPQDQGEKEPGPSESVVTELARAHAPSAGQRAVEALAKLAEKRVQVMEQALEVRPRPVMGRHASPTERRKRKFLTQLARHGTVIRACESMGISRQSAYRWKLQDEEFASQWQEILDVVNDDFYAVGFERARDGWLEPVYHKGELVGAVRRFSDGLFLEYLHNRLPETRTDRHAPDGTTAEDFAASILELGQAMLEASSAEPPEEDVG